MGAAARSGFLGPGSTCKTPSWRGCPTLSFRPIGSAMPPGRRAGHVALGSLEAMWGLVMDVGGWLRSLGLGQYEEKFRDNRIEADLLPRLTVDDLKDIGVSVVGDRRRLLDAIAALADVKPLADVPASRRSPRRPRVPSSRLNAVRSR